MSERAEPVVGPQTPGTAAAESPDTTAAGNAAHARAGDGVARLTRLKSGVRARSLADEGVAVSMGATAVVVRGARADALWRALEPTLRAGFDRASLVAGFPARGREFLEDVLDQWEDHGFLRELEDEHELSASERAAYPHVESLTARPFAALRAIADSVVRVRSRCPLLEAQVRRALGRAGFRDVRTDTGPGAGVLLTARVGVPGCRESLHLIAAGHGVWVSGPRDAPGDADLARRVRRWFDGLGASAAETAEAGDSGDAGDASDLAITRSLVAAQLALALVAHAARSVGGPGTPPHDVPGSGGAASGALTDPEFMVTTDELISEPHPFVALPALGEGGPDAASPPWPTPPPPVSAPAPSLPERLEGVAHLWDRVFGPVGEPVPGDLPQLPVGLARVERSVVRGCGTTTAEARLDALLTALGAVAWPGGPDGGRPPDGASSATAPDDAAVSATDAEGSGPAGVGRGLGLTLPAAVGAAVGDLALRTDAGWKDTGPPPPLSAPARRLWAALTLRFGVAASARVQEWDGTGLLRVEVRAPDGALLGRSVSPDADAAVREALTRAVADAALDDGSVAVSATRTAPVLASLTRWAAASGRVAVGQPTHAEEWAARGVYAAVASWT